MEDHITSIQMEECTRVMSIDAKHFVLTLTVHVDAYTPSENPQPLIDLVGYTKAELARAQKATSQNEKRANPCVYLTDAPYELLEGLLNSLQMAQCTASDQTASRYVQVVLEVAKQAFEEQSAAVKTKEQEQKKKDQDKALPSVPNTTGGQSDRQASAGTNRAVSTAVSKTNNSK